MTADIKQLSQCTTKSTIIITSTFDHERTLLRKWCDKVAANGGSFSIDHTYSNIGWCATYTINWPKGMTYKDVV